MFIKLDKLSNIELSALGKLLYYAESWASGRVIQSKAAIDSNVNDSPLINTMRAAHFRWCQEYHEIITAMRDLDHER
jgi:hypothetical protein